MNVLKKYLNSYNDYKEYMKNNAVENMEVKKSVEKFSEILNNISIKHDAYIDPNKSFVNNLYNIVEIDGKKILEIHLDEGRN